jgi:hypothetical protein
MEPFGTQMAGQLHLRANFPEHGVVVVATAGATLYDYRPLTRTSVLQKPLVPGRARFD